MAGGIKFSRDDFHFGQVLKDEYLKTLLSKPAAQSIFGGR